MSIILLFRIILDTRKMDKHLFFVCPTDYIETEINRVFSMENYFVSSLGNSIHFNKECISGINSLILSKGVNQVSFVLSDTNKIVLDALRKVNLKDINVLNGFQDMIMTEDNYRKCIWPSADTQYSSISDYLNFKRREFKRLSQQLLINNVGVNALIYKREELDFFEVNDALFDLDECRLN